MTSHVGIDAALANPFGAGSYRLQQLAHETLSRAGVGAWADPRRIAVELGFRIRAMTSSGSRAEVRGDCISYLWDPESREWGLNMFIGLAMATLGAKAPESDVYRFAGYLALPGDDRFDVHAEADAQIYCPLWFITSHQRRRWAGPKLRLCRGG